MIATEPQYEVRRLPSSEVRLAPGKATKLQGYAAVFNSLSLPIAEGGMVFRERIRPGAFADTLADGHPIRAQVEHSGGLETIGSTENGTLRLHEDAKGLAFELTPPDTQAGRDTLQLVANGFLTEMSFGFTVPEGGDEFRQNGELIRILNRVNLREVSVVGDAAYPQTAVSARGKMKRHDPTLGFRSLGHWATDVRTACQPGDSNETVRAALTTYGDTTVGASGGFAMPPAYADEVETLVREKSLAQFCDIIPVESNSFTSVYSEDAPWSTSGFVFSWQAEANALTQRRPLLTAATQTLDKLLCFAPVSDELLDDVPALSAYLRDGFAAGLAYKINEMIIRGTGSGQGMGLLNASALISVAKEGSQTADTVVAENIRKMFARAFISDERRTVWIVHPTVLRDLWEDAGQLAWHVEGGRVWLYGFRVFTSQGCEEIGDLGDIYLCDLSQYRIVQRAAKLMMSTHFYFDQDTACFRSVTRLDGTPKVSATIADRDGSSTTSPYVALAARA